MAGDDEGLDADLSVGVEEGLKTFGEGEVADVVKGYVQYFGDEWLVISIHVEIDRGHHCASAGRGCAQSV